MTDLKARIALLVKKRFPPKIYMELISKGFKHLGDEWVVPAERKSEFERIVGTPIHAGEGVKERAVYEVEVVTDKKGVSLEPPEIIEGEGVYHVRLSNGKSPYTIPSSIVETYYEVVDELRKRGVRRIKKRELVEKALRRLGVTRYFSRDGSRFYWEAFYGDRVSYHTHYYVPVKILEAKGIVRVTKHDDIVIL